MAQMILLDSVLAEEMAASIFVPVVTFNRPPAFPWKGEYALAAAVFTDAITLYRRHRHAVSRRGRTLFQQEKEWIFSDDTSWLFSFVNICNLLGLDPSAVRVKIRSETKEKLKEFLKQTGRGVSKNRINLRL